jgi:hypothetical protein
VVGQAAGTFVFGVQTGFENPDVFLRVGVSVLGAVQGVAEFGNAVVDVRFFAEQTLETFVAF